MLFLWLSSYFLHDNVTSSEKPSLEPSEVEIIFVLSHITVIMAFLAPSPVELCDLLIPLFIFVFPNRALVPWD